MKNERQPPEKLDHNQTVQKLRDEVLNRLRADYRNQTAKPLSDYGGFYPQLAGDDEFLLDLIYTDVLCREQAGLAVAAVHYQEQYPHLAEAIERQLLVHRGLGDVDLSNATGQIDLENFGQRISASRDTMPMTAPQPSSTAGENRSDDAQNAWPTLPGLSIEAELGRGGMGIVYKALQLQLKRTVAVKVLRQQAGDEEESLTRFRSEAEAIAKLRHPHIVQIYDSSVLNGLPFLVLEYIDGENLSTWCRLPQRQVSTVTRLIEIVARAVDYAHQQHIVHRDLKPANILLARCEQGAAIENGSQSNLSLLDDLTQHCWQPKIADFGLAKQIQNDDQQLTRTQAILGTAAYLSPEQAWGRSREVAATTDIHALGIILYELLTGHSPFHGESLIHTLDNVRFLNPPPPSELNDRVPAWLDAVCARCLAKDPRDRYRSAAELADELAGSVDNHVGSHSLFESLRLSKRVGAKTQRPSAFFFVGALAIVCGILFAVSRRYSDNRPAEPAIDPRDGSAVNAVPLRNSPETMAPATPRKVGTNRAFLVGVRGYEFPSGSVQLQYTEADVDEMARVLNRHDFPREHIQLMTQWSQADNPRLAPSADNLRVQLKQFFVESIEDDTVIVMLTGMGGETQPQGNYFYLPSDAKLNDANSLIPLSEFLNLLKQCPAKQKLLVFDTCQTVSLAGQNFPAISIPDGVSVLLACSAHQVSYEDATLRHGVFSHFLIKALEGESDRDGDRHIRLGELIEFTRQNVQSFLSKNQAGAEQTPMLLGTLPLDASIVRLPSGQ